MRIVCNLERPSELSWRARHGRKKNTAVGEGSLGCPGMKVCDDSGLYVCLTILDYILEHCLLVNGMWLLCAGEDELMRVRLFHPGCEALHLSQ